MSDPMPMRARVRRACTLIAAATAVLSGASVATARDAPSPYNGGDAVSRIRLPNGATVNARLGADPFLKSDPRLLNVGPNIWTVTGYALSNCSFVITPQGIVVFDTGGNIGQGEYFLKQIRRISAKPIIAIIYSHSHYSGGASAFAEGRDVPVYASARLMENQRQRSLDRAPSVARRANLQFGAYLPRTGADAVVQTPEPEFDSAQKKRSGFLPVTHPVADGEEVRIGGTRFIFRWTNMDTTDSLTVSIPELKAVLTNVVSNMFYPLYTLRGEEYRSPLDIIQSFDIVRNLNAEYYVPVHGAPIVGHGNINKRLLLHRDAYAFTYYQALRGINLGWTPDEIVQRTSLPQRFLDEPSLNEIYSEFDYALRGVYRGLIGWFAEDTADLNPPSPARLGQSIVDGFGGLRQLLQSSKAAMARKEYDLAAKLAGYAVSADPDNTDARQAKADALRQLARVSRGFQSYNFYLTEALALEGKVDRFCPPPFAEFGIMSAAVLAQMPGSDLVGVLQSRIDPVRSSARFRSIAIRFANSAETYRINVRDGVVEVNTDDHASGPVLEVPRTAWARFLQGDISADQLVQEPDVHISGDPRGDVKEILGYFPPPSPANCKPQS